MKVRVNIYGEIGWNVTLASVAAEIPKNATEIFVNINSVGGDVEEGFAIMNFLESHPAKVTTIIEGVCYSIATVIALSGEERKMFPTAELMIHNPWGQVQGDADEIAKYSEWIKKAEDKLIGFYSSRLELEPSQVAEKMKSTTFIDASEAFSLGFITEEAKQYKAVAKIKTDNKSMDKLNEADRGWLAKQFESLKNLFGAKAMVELTVETEDSEFPVYVDSEDGELEGKSVYLNEEMTEPAPQGVHRLRDGREITVNAEGMIDSVKEAETDPAGMEDDEKKAMQEEIESLKAELARYKQEAEEATQAKAQKEEENQTLSSNLAKAQAVVEEIKAKFAPLMDAPTGGKGDPAPKKDGDLSASAQVLEYFKKNKKEKVFNTDADSVLDYFKNKN